MWNRIPLQIAFLLLVPGTAKADASDCASLLQQDIHDKLVIVDNSTGKQVSTSSLCSSQQKSSSSNFSISYAGAGIGFGDGSALAQAMCNNLFSESDIANGHNVYQTVIDPNIMKAVMECYTLNSRGLHYSLQTNLDVNSVGISMYYDGPTPVTISDINVDGNAQCEGQLYNNWISDNKQPIVLGPKVIGLVCKSKDQQIPSTNTNDVPAGAVTIFSDAGPIYAQIPRRFSPSLESQFKQQQAQLSTLSTQAQNLSTQLAKVQNSDNYIDNSYIKGTDTAPSGVAGTTNGISGLRLINGLDQDFAKCPAGSFVSAIQGIAENLSGNPPIVHLRYACRSVK
jgi:hypothetical protein